MSVTVHSFNRSQQRTPRTKCLFPPFSPVKFFGIIGAEHTTDLTISKPTLSGTDPARRDGSVLIVWDKCLSDGVNIYSKRGDEAAFTLLDRDNDSPYTDDRPLLVAGKPELREYKAVRILADAEIGLFSDEIVVNCAP